LSDPSTGKSTVVQGLNSVPADQRPTTSEVNIIHLAWDVMIGIGTLLLLLSAWYAGCWLFRRDMPKNKVFLSCASAAGIASIVALEAGWTVAEVGRQPFIVRNQMTVEQGATTNDGVWLTFSIIAAIYLVVGVTTVLILRGMSRRWRATEVVPETEVPYGPNVSPEPPRRTGAAHDEVTVE
jgi:cytochrome d ubiquinol oxidase subunit I